MSNLENLTAKILAEAKERAGEITAAAKAEAETGIARDVAAAQVEADKLVTDAKTEAELTAERIVQGKTLAIRDENLGAKRQMLDKVFAEALKRLNGMPEDEYLSYLKGYLPKLDLQGQTVIVPAKYSSAAKALEKTPEDKRSVAEDGLAAFVNGVIDRFVNKGSNTEEPGVKLEFSDKIDGGFVLVKDGIEQNHTFSALLDYYRYELESEVLKILYA